ncbi:MAG TPA: hypothetical protein VGD14_09565 [bacterium]
MNQINYNDQKDKTALSSILALRTSQDFSAYMDFIGRQLYDIRKTNDHATGQQRDWNQGWCQAFQYILDLPGLAETLRKQEIESQKQGDYQYNPDLWNPKAL